MREHDPHHSIFCCRTCIATLYGGAGARPRSYACEHESDWVLWECQQCRLSKINAHANIDGKLTCIYGSGTYTSHIELRTAADLTLHRFTSIEQSEPDDFNELDLLGKPVPYEG